MEQIDFEKVLMLIIPYLNKDNLNFNYFSYILILFSMYNIFSKNLYFLKDLYYKKNSGLIITSHITSSRIGQDKILRQKFSNLLLSFVFELIQNENIGKFKEIKEIFGNDDNWGDREDYIKFPISKDGIFLYNFNFVKNRISKEKTKETCEIWVKSNLIIDDDFKNGKPEINVFSDKNDSIYLNIYSNFIEEKYDYYLKNKEDKNQCFVFEIENLFYEENNIELKISKIQINHNKNEDNFFHADKDKIINYIRPFKKKNFNTEVSDFEKKCNKLGKTFKKGFLVYGEPGNGKTSFIKFIQHYTNRHLMFINLSIFKNDQELKTAIPFTKKINGKIYNSDELIYVFEDCDAQCDWIHKRNNETENSLNIKGNGDNNKIKDELEKELLKSVMKKDTPTLSRLLNILDGPVELPGALFIFSTNHPEKLDPALKRPGRIDHSIYFSNASLKIIKEMFIFYFELKNKHLSILENIIIKDNILSVCVVQNIICKYCFEEFSLDNCNKCITELILESQKKEKN